MSGLALRSLQLGEWLIYLIKLQIFYWLTAFRYGLVLGIFPAQVAIFSELFAVFEGKSHTSELRLAKFLLVAKTNCKPANQLGWASCLIALILLVDIRVSQVFLHNSWLHGCLVVLLTIWLVVNFYLFPSLIRYDLRVRDVAKQAFFLVLASIPQTLAMLVCFAIMAYLSVLFPLLGLLPIVLFSLPVVFFGLQAMRRLESRHQGVG